MNTLGEKTITKVTLEESYILAKSFMAKGDLTKGQVVKMAADGTIEPIAATTDKPFGTLAVGAKDGDYATVMTDFKAVLKSKADGDITVGAEVSVSSYDATNKNDNYKVSAAGDFVTGIALTAATDTEYVEVGILRSPYKL